MSILPPGDLAALGLAPEMIGPVEHLQLPTPDVDQALGISQPDVTFVLSSRVATNARDAQPLAEGASDALVDARSDVLRAIGVDLRLDRAEGALQLEWAADTDVRVRDVRPDRPLPAAADGYVRLTLRQVGRFLVESPAGVPLVLGVLEDDTLALAAVSAWPAPPLDHWTGPMTDEWLQSTVARALPGADAWTRTALAGAIARLAAVAPSSHAPGASSAGTPDDGGAHALLRRVSASPATIGPRSWARGLDPGALASIEEHARRRAIALEHDLDHLLAVFPAEATEARAAWTRVCHRRDDLEGVRLLLLEAGAGDGLDEALRDTDRAGRSLRLSLNVAVDDERLRRVALGDPGAWWGDPAYEVRLL